MTPSTATLLVTCPDQPGLVASIATYVSQRGGNVLAADEHVEVETGTFFMRVVWDLARSTISRQELPADVATFCAGMGFAHDLSFSDTRPRAAVFASRTPHCLYDLLLNDQLDELGGDVVLVISNHADLAAVAEHFGKPFVHVPAEEPEAMEATHRKLLADYGVDLVVLARYMRVLSAEFVHDWRNRVINIHHSFLPAFIGAEAYRQAKERGVKMIGATAHYATEALDQGPIIEQDTARISHRDGLIDVVRKGRDLERKVLTRAVRVHLEHRILVSGNRTIVFE